MAGNYGCLNCGHQWTSRKKVGLPPRCPKCNSLNIESLEIPYILSQRGKNDFNRRISNPDWGKNHI